MAAVRRRPSEPLTLRAMAEMADLSPFHFDRVFRAVAGAAPFEFQAAVRIDEAKRLLVTTDLSVTEVCFEMGYSSLGTFSARFARLVGASPASLRRIAQRPLQDELLRLGQLGPLRPAAPPAYRPDASGGALGVRGEITLDRPGPTLVFVGLFSERIPQGWPVAGTILPRPGPFRIVPVPDGRYHLLAAAVPWFDDPQRMLLPGDALRVGTAGPTTVHGGGGARRLGVAMRPPAPTDPPIVVALPLLLARRVALIRERAVPGAR